MRNKLIQKNEKYETSYLKLMEEYNGYKATVNALNLSKAGYNSANEALKTAPYELILNDKQYLEFIEDYKNNPDAYQDLKKVAIEQGNLIYNGKYDKYMTDEQKQLYYYQRYVLNDKEAANEYLTVISNSVKEAYAIDVSAEFVKDITHSDNWFETFLEIKSTMLPENFSNKLLMDSSDEYIQEWVEAMSGNAMANVVLGEKRNLLDDAQESNIEKFNTTAILGLGNKTGQIIHKPKFTKH